METVDLYIRARCEHKEQQHAAEKMQENELRKYCRLHHLSIGQVIIDQNSAGCFNKWPWEGYLQNVREAKDKPSMLLFTEWDRFSRNISTTLDTVNKLMEVGIVPMSVQEAFCWKGMS